MTKNGVLKVVNIILAILVINQITGPFLLENEIISYPVFKWMHKRAVWVLMATLLAHLILNWNWIKANYFKKQG